MTFLNASDYDVTYLNSTDIPLFNVTLTTDPDKDDGSCEIKAKYSIISAIAAVICFLFGVLYTFFGYRCFKAIMFLMGFIFGTVFVFMIIDEQKILPPEGTLGAAVGSGILLGLLTMLIPVTGVFLTGFGLGLSLAAVILVAAEEFTHPSTKWIPISVFLALGIVLGIIGLKLQKAFVIIGTSVIGAALGLAGIDYFLELSRGALYIWDRLLAHHSSNLCWLSWLMLALWPLCALLGVLVQWRLTGADVDHTISVRHCREQSTNLQQARSQQRRETQQTRYRHLYQARRVKGDVVSQNFIQSIQHKLSPAMQSLTALNVDPSNEEESMTTVQSNDA